MVPIYMYSYMYIKTALLGWVLPSFFLKASVQFGGGGGGLGGGGGGGGGFPPSGHLVKASSCYLCSWEAMDPPPPTFLASSSIL